MPNPQETPDDPVPAVGWIRPEALDVAPALVGLALARPWPRLLAMGLDLAVVALLSGVSGLWLVAGMALVVLQLRSPALGTPARRLALGWLGAALIGLLVLHEAKTKWDELHEPVAAAEVAAPSSGAASTPTDAQRIATLEAELAEARRSQPTGAREMLNELIDAFGLSFGWGVVYFSLLPAWWGGQTVGKKLFGLRVVELTGKPMTVMRCLKRYGGYAAGMATGGLGFVQLLWDPNRQALQDKAAHTVVIDLRAPRGPALTNRATAP